jgi:hypothetical protein
MERVEREEEINVKKNEYLKTFYETVRGKLFVPEIRIRDNEKEIEAKKEEEKNERQRDFYKKYKKLFEEDEHHFLNFLNYALFSERLEFTQVNKNDKGYSEEENEKERKDFKSL